MMPVLAVGGDHSYGAHLATEIGFVAADVRAAVIENCGHWIMEEQSAFVLSDLSCTAHPAMTIKPNFGALARQFGRLD